MSHRARLTIGLVFTLSMLALLGHLGGLFLLFYNSSRDAIMESSDRLRAQASARIGRQVEDFLGEAEDALRGLEGRIRAGAVQVDPLALEAALYGELVQNPNLAEATLTSAVPLGRDKDGWLEVATEGRRQLSVYRTRARSGDGERIVTRSIASGDGGFRSAFRRRAAGGSFLGAALEPEPGSVPDPTEHLTFRTPARADFSGRVLWSDLHWSELDASLPEEERRGVMTVQSAVQDGDGRFLGVLRIAIVAEQIDAIARRNVSEGDEHDPHRVFICDAGGGLITRAGPRDRLRASEGTVRVQAENLAPELAQALREPSLRGVAADASPRSTRFRVNGLSYLLTYRPIARTQDWVLGILVPEDAYLGGLRAARRRILLVELAVMASILLFGTLTLRVVRGGLGRIEQETGRMRNFDFAPSSPRALFCDVENALESLELAKTAMRAMGKYVPIDLVRDLYKSNREPVLGGEQTEVSILFTDIKDFTTLSEQLTVDRLAAMLGRYLEVMTTTIHRFQGTVDKYIGDAVMVIWNAPRPCPNHAEMACRAALACLEETAALNRVFAAEGLPTLHTRFGIHRDRVMVGHFGAPDRMSYTAIGDGVNLAARLEGQNKQYGTTILVSDAIVREAGAGFRFRRLDRVAVKGKSKGIDVFELCGLADASEDSGRAGLIRRYEDALAAYFARDFAAAIALLEGVGDDPPSGVLLARSRRLRESPPPADWDGIWVATSK